MTTSSVLIDEVRQLLDCDLYDSALQLAELECKPRLADSRVPATERLALLKVLCQCLDAQKQYRLSLKAITDFVGSPVKSQLTWVQLEDVARDIADARWKLGEHDLCLSQLRQIPTLHRTAKDLSRMARCAALIQSPDAPDLYKDLLKAQPNATEAYTYLHSLHSPGNTALSDDLQHVPDSSNYHDVLSIARARSLMAKLGYHAAAKELQILSRRHRNNAQIIALQATCWYMLNDTRRAKVFYDKARSLDPSLFHEMGTYSNLLYSTSGDAYSVYRLGNELLKVDQTKPEGWVAMARYFLMTGQIQEALAIVWKAQTLAPSYEDAYYAEGTIQMASDCPEEAAEAFLKAHELRRNTLTYRGVVEAYIQCGKYKEAFLVAKEAAELMPTHAAALAMVGVVLSHSPESYAKAVKLLESALDIDHRCTEAISALASLYVSNERFADAIKLIEKYLPENETDEMFTHYADVLTLANELPKAAVNYTAALALNPANERAKTGFDRVDRLLHPNLADTEADIEDSAAGDDNEPVAQDEGELQDDAGGVLHQESPFGTPLERQQNMQMDSGSDMSDDSLL
ncbi:hypothetical protein GGI12_000417 [Dipsacomyces acuminosporus]|nr:hypothetical protein GGI12_000417 [Dipsacomyces acuminosporus]